MTGLQLFQILKARIGKREAEAFVSYVDESRQQMIADCRSIFATKEDLALLRNQLQTELSELRGEMREELRGETSSIRTEMASLRGNLEVKISDVRSDVIRWMFAFFVTMLAAIIGLYFKK